MVQRIRRRIKHDGPLMKPRRGTNPPVSALLASEGWHQTPRFGHQTVRGNLPDYLWLYFCSVRFLDPTSSKSVLHGPFLCRSINVVWGKWVFPTRNGVRKVRSQVFLAAVLIPLRRALDLFYTLLCVEWSLVTLSLTEFVIFGNQFSASPRGAGIDTTAFISGHYSREYQIHSR